MVQPLTFENELVISSQTLLGIWLLIHAEIKIDPYQWKWANVCNVVLYLQAAVSCENFVAITLLEFG